MATSNWVFVTAAYTVTWALILGYVAWSQRALRRARAAYRRVTGHAPGGNSAS